MSLTEEIKNYALDLGYHSVGITTADPFPLYEQSLNERSEDYSWAVETGLRLNLQADPHNRLPGAKSIIVTVEDYFQSHFPANLVGRIGRIYIDLATHKTIERRSRMRKFLEKRGMQIGPWYGISSGVSDRLAAVRAGLGQQGLNTFFCAQGIGTFVSPHTYIVDAELEYDAPASGTHCPPGCRACIDACPTGAIVANFRMNPHRCITFNNLASVEGVRDVSPYIDPELRPKMGEWIHGCDRCQEACPKNETKLRGNFPADAFLDETSRYFNLPGILRMDKKTETKAASPLLYNYVNEKKYFQRNAAIALGNSGDPEMTTHLSRAMENAAELVRAHAAWALGRLGGTEARRALETSLSREEGTQAKKEIREALERV